MGNADVLQIRRRRENGQGESLTRLEGSDWIYVKIDAAQADIPEDSLTLKGGASIRPAAMILQRQGNTYPIKPPFFHRVSHEVALVHYNRDQAAGLARAAQKYFWGSLCPSLTPTGARVNCLTDGMIAPVFLNQK
jgi:hypothetical protein